MSPLDVLGTDHGHFYGTKGAFHGWWVCVRGSANVFWGS